MLEVSCENYTCKAIVALKNLDFFYVQRDFDLKHEFMWDWNRIGMNHGFWWDWNVIGSHNGLWWDYKGIYEYENTIEIKFINLSYVNFENIREI